MKLITGNKFILNGVEERIIKMPKNRNEEITITMNGSRDYAQTIPIEVFEYNTGLIILGLEPERNINLSEQIERLSTHLSENDFEVDFNDQGNLTSYITFTNKENSKIKVSLYSFENSDGSLGVRLTKSANGRENKGYDLSTNNGDLQVDLIIDQVNRFTRHKTQVLSKKTDIHSTRMLDENGLFILKVGESLDDFFNENSDRMHAGIVVTSDKDKFMPFTSYESRGKRTLNYETKSYKRLQSAVKFLDERGHDKDGKVKDSAFNIEDVKTALINNSNRFSSMTRWDDITAQIEVNTGFIIYDLPRIESDEVEGAKCIVDFTHVRELDGIEFKGSIQVTHEHDGNYSVRQPLWQHSNDIDKALSEGEIKHPEDTRSNSVRYKYHINKIKNLTTSLKRYEERHSSSDDNFWSDKIEETQKSIDHHKKSAKEVKVDKTQDFER